MPNWVYNSLTIQGNKKDINDFIKKVTTVQKGKRIFSFDKIIPAPTLMSQCPTKYLDPKKSHAQPLKGKAWFDWYNWNVDNWGVKWDACESFIQKSDDCCQITFQTAWSSPDPIIKAVGKNLTKNLTLNWYAEEESGEFEFEVEYDNNQCVRSTDRSFPVDKPRYKTK